MKKTFLPFLHLATAGIFILTACGSKSTPASVPTAVDLPLTETPQPTITVMPTPTFGIGSTRISEKDGATLVYVPAGEFAMGSTDQDSLASKDERPQHPVTLDAFWIDQTEVTNAMYAKCVNAGNCKPPINTDHFINTGYANHPVVSVDWSQANAYCVWSERRLLTEAEWEKAARGTDGRIYPWGNEAPSNAFLNYNDAVKDTTAVGQYPNGKSPYGAYDMAGNVWEWTNDWYSETYYQSSSASNPVGPASSAYQAFRGGSWNNNDYFVRSANRGWVEPTSTGYFIGFRCAQSTTSTVITPIKAETAQITATATLKVVVSTPIYSQPMIDVGGVVNCRKGPSPNYERVTQLVPNQPVKIVGFLPPNYWLVSTVEGECWVTAELATPSVNFSAVPTVTAPPTPQGGAPQAPTFTKKDGWTWFCDGAGNTDVTLNWNDNADHETGYRVYRNGELVSELPANTTSYKENIVYPGEQGLTYTVEAFNEAGASSGSTEALFC